MEDKSNTHFHCCGRPPHMAFLGQSCSKTFFGNSIPNFQVLLKMSTIVDKMFTAHIVCDRNISLSEQSINGNVIPCRPLG